MANTDRRRPGRRRVLPVVVWFHAGAAIAAAGIALSAAPTAAADEGATATSAGTAQPRPSAARSGTQRANTTARRDPQRPITKPSVAAAKRPAASAAARRVRPAQPAMLDRAKGLSGGGAAESASVSTVTVAPAVTTGAAPAVTTGASIRLAVFGDAGNSYTNGTNFYYSPGTYRRYDTGASGPLQQAVAEMMRSWNPTDVIQLGDASYNSASSTLLDYNIGQYYNNWIHPYVPPAYTQPGSIYTDGTLGGVTATPGKTQWPYNVYNYPNGFPNPTDPSLPGGSPDGVNHYFAVPGNHDEAEILGTYNDFSVDQVNFGRDYIGAPIGPDAYDYQNNIKNTPTDTTGKIDAKTGSNQSFLDYHAYLDAGNPGNLTPGSLNIGKLDPNGYGIYYGVDLGDASAHQVFPHGLAVDLLHQRHELLLAHGRDAVEHGVRVFVAALHPLEVQHPQSALFA